MRSKFSTICISLLVAFVLAACGSGGTGPTAAQATAAAKATEQHGANEFHAQLTAIATEGATR